jgi:hypothetical protein
MSADRDADGLPGGAGRRELDDEANTDRRYAGWVWRSYERRPAWAAEATIDEWASRIGGE